MIQRYKERIAALEEIELNWRDTIEKARSNAADRSSAAKIEALKAETESYNLESSGQPIEALAARHRSESIMLERDFQNRKDEIEVRELEATTRHLSPLELTELVELRQRLAAAQIDGLGR